MTFLLGKLSQRLLAKRRLFAVLLSACVLVSIVAVVLATRNFKQIARAAADEHGHKHEGHNHSHGEADETHPAGVVMMPIEEQWGIKLKHVVTAHSEVAQQITATGRIVPAAGYQVVIAPPVGGQLSAPTDGYLPRVGQRVTKGQTLAVLRQQTTAAEAAQIAAANAQLQIEQARLEAERKRLTQEVEEAKGNFDLAVIALDHANRLYARKAYSVHQHLEAKAKHKAAEAAYQSAVQQLEALKSVQLPAAETAKLTGLALAAPLSGTVVKVRKAVGDHVAAGEAILEIVNLETVWLEAPIFERDLHHLDKGVRAVFTTPAYPGTEFSGALVDIGAVIDEQSRAATVIFQAQNAGRALLVGMQANVRLAVGAKSEALLIPKDAVQENDGRKMVFVVLTGEEFEPRDVTVGDEYGDKVAVLTGLQEGERVVTQGAYQLRLKQLRPSGGGEHAGHNHAH